MVIIKEKSFPLIMQSVEIVKKTTPITLLPHQRRLQSKLPELEFPFFLYWGMGSGKTIGGCIFFQLLEHGDKGLVICDKSLVNQWKREIQRFLGKNNKHYNDVDIQLIHYEYLEKDEDLDLSQFKMIIVDEAHRFRNAWSRDSVRMLSWVDRIHLSDKVVFLSGTPIMNDAESEMKAFYKLMLTNNPQNKLFYYDPRADMKTKGSYASTDHLNEYCYMTWAQCFKYLINRKQTFELQLPNEDYKRIRTTSKQFAYNTQLRTICNNPYPETPELSPKLTSLRDNIQSYLDQNMKQIIYSSRRDAGIDALDNLLEEDLYRIDGSMSIDERSESIRKFNLRPKSILLITDAGGQGVDLKRVDIVHLMEPADSIQEENQIINRAVRYKSHKENYSKVTIIHYIMKFPTTCQVCAPWKNELYQSGMFSKHEMKDLSKKVQKALYVIIENEENNETLDEKIFRNRIKKEEQVQEKLSMIRSWSI